jgi:hypothetical protein
MTSHPTARSFVGRGCGEMARLSGGCGGEFLGNAPVAAGSVGLVFPEHTRQKPRFGRK